MTITNPSAYNLLLAARVLTDKGLDQLADEVDKLTGGNTEATVTLRALRELAKGRHA